MLKSIKFLTMLTLFLVISSVSFAQFETIWENSAANSTLPTWFSASASTERGFTVGVVDGNERVFVASRNGGSFIYIVDATDGSDVGQLDMTGVSGGTFAINDVDVSADGEIYACNLTTGGLTSAFKVYRWANESAQPEVVIESTTFDGRYGDKFTVKGSKADNSLKIMAANGSAGNFVIYSTADNGASFTGAQVIMSDNAAGSSPSVDMIPSLGYLYNGNGTGLKYYDFGGMLEGTVDGAVIPTGTNAVRHFYTMNNILFSAVFRYGTGFQNAMVVELGGFSGEASLYAMTPTLGANANGNGTGDVSVKDNGDGSFTIYVMCTNNGFGAYTTTDAPLPVELTSFTANTTGTTVNLTWKTASELNNRGFAVERRAENGSYTQIAFVDGAVNSLEEKVYNFADANLQAGTYFYRLRQTDLDGSYTVSNEISVEVTVPQEFSLSQNYPNPFNPTTVIKFSTPENSNVKLSVFNMLGEEITTLVNGYKEAGSYEVKFDASNLNSGIYLYKIEAGDFVNIKKMMLVK